MANEYGSKTIAAARELISCMADDVLQTCTFDTRPEALAWARRQLPDVQRIAEMRPESDAAEGDHVLHSN